MIGLPFGANDTTCLTAASEWAADMVARRDPILMEYAQRFHKKEEAYEYIRSQPQRDDQGDPNDGPKLEACDPWQRLQFPSDAPNCFERSVAGMIAAEILDPHSVYQLATLEFPWGRHTILLENGYPVILDPRVGAGDIEQGLASGLASNVPEQIAPETVEAVEIDERDDQPSKRRRKRNRVAVDVYDALEFTHQLGDEATRDHRNGPRRAWLARNAIRSLLETRTPPTDPQMIETLHWFFGHAEDIAHMYGPRALTIVRTTAAAIWDLIEDILAQEEHQQRNLSFEIGGSHYSVPSWLSDAAGTVGKIGLDLGAAYVRPYLIGAGLTGEMLGLVEQELNTEGYSLGPLSKQNQSVSSALAAIGGKKK